MTCLVSGGADSTCLWHAAPRARLRRPRGTRPPRPARRRGGRRRRALRRGVRGGDRRTPTPAATEAELRDSRYALTAGRGLRATGHTASDQVETVLYRLVSSGSTRGIRPRGPTASCGRCSRVWREETEAYCRVARPLVARRLDERRHEARPDPRAAAAAPRGARPPRARQPAGARERAAPPPPRARGVARRAALVPGGDTRGRSRRWCAGRSRVRHAAARGSRDLGAVAARDRPSRASSSGRAGRATVSRAAPVRCRMCSWTPRCRGTSATPGRSSRPRTARSSRSSASRRRPAGRERCGPTRGQE